MNPEEKALLERTLKLTEENNEILRRMHKAARWGLAWGFIKIVFIVVPLVLGYIFLQPFFGQIRENYSGVNDLLKNFGQ